MHQISVSGSLGLRAQVYFLGCVLSAVFWGLFVVRPQACLEVDARAFLLRDLAQTDP